MEYYSVLLPLALIMATSKVLSKAASKINMPQVVGMLLAGVVIGLINYIPNQQILTETSMEGVGFIAKLGVIMIMFSAGLETDIKQIKSIGAPAMVITAAGVIVPMGLGFVVACLFNGGFSAGKEILLNNLFYGVILTATSVSVSVATLKELGKLSSKVGTTVIAAAIIDDIIGVIVLSFVIAMKGTDGQSQSPLRVTLMTALFFVAAGLFGTCAKQLMQVVEKRYPHHRLLPIFGLATCFFFAYASEKWFGVADITGAFAAGLFLSRNPESGYIDRRTDIMSYMIFTPVFFANIGMTVKFNSINPAMILFGLCFILAGLAGKVFGCAGASLLCKYSPKDSLRVGVGMMARAEVALVCAQKGVENGMINSAIMPFILMLIIASSFITPMILKKSYKKQAE
ncbi:MAG: cation:proton antiporter [Clostridia bacterium]|nr:cation:proton antiporter [Clostridia bacterium]